MHLTIDQSPRIEDWTDDSVIAFANTEEKAIILTSPGSRGPLRTPRPLRTVRKTLALHGSSLEHLIAMSLVDLMVAVRMDRQPIFYSI